MGIPYKKTTPEQDAAILQKNMDSGELISVELNPYNAVIVYTKFTHKELWKSDLDGDVELIIHSNIWVNYPAYALKGKLTKDGREYIFNKNV